MESKLVEKSEQLIDAIDSSIKRLVTPTAFIIAAGVLLTELETNAKHQELIYISVFSLIFFAILYTGFSVMVIAKKLESVVSNKNAKIIVGSFYSFLYLILWLVAIKTGFAKL